MELINLIFTKISGKTILTLVVVLSWCTLASIYLDVLDMG